MEIKNDQHFYSILLTEGINKKDFQSEQDLFCAVIDLGDTTLIDYVMKNHPDKLSDDAVCNACNLSIGIFARLVNVAVKHSSDNINLEDIAIKCFQKVKEDHTIEDIMKFLFEYHRVDPNGKHGMIFTEACHYGSLPAVKYLIEEMGVDPNINDEMGYIFACRFGHYEVAQYLIENGANYKARNYLGLKILMTNPIMDTPAKKWLFAYHK